MSIIHLGISSSSEKMSHEDNDNVRGIRKIVPYVKEEERLHPFVMNGVKFFPNGDVIKDGKFYPHA